MVVRAWSSSTVTTTATLNGCARTPGACRPDGRSEGRGILRPGLLVDSPALADRLEEHFASLIRDGHLERLPLP